MIFCGTRYDINTIISADNWTDVVSLAEIAKLILKSLIDTNTEISNHDFSKEVQISEYHF